MPTDDLSADVAEMRRQKQVMDEYQAEPNFPVWPRQNYEGLAASLAPRLADERDRLMAEVERLMASGDVLEKLDGILRSGAGRPHISIRWRGRGFFDYVADLKGAKHEAESLGCQHLHEVLTELVDGWNAALEVKE